MPVFKTFTGEDLPEAALPDDRPDPVGLLEGLPALRRIGREDGFEVRSDFGCQAAGISVSVKLLLLLLLLMLSLLLLLLTSRQADVVVVVDGSVVVL